MVFSSSAFPYSETDLVFGVIQILLIDLVLAGDNAVVIAMVVRSLPEKERKLGIIFGAGLAIILRVFLTFFASQLLQINFVKLVGGMLIFWIGCKLLFQDAEARETGRQATSVWNAIWIITVADVTMSTDNILALAATSRGNLPLLMFGLTLSIPLVIFTSDLLSKLMAKHPLIICLGAAILGKVSAEMIFTDPAVSKIIRISEYYLYILEIIFALAVITIAKLYLMMKRESVNGDQ